MSSKRNVPKYQDENPLLRLHPGEPYFFIRAQDKLSADAVINYSHLLQREANKAVLRQEHELAEALSAQVAEVVSFAHKFLDWQEENQGKVKLPD